MKTKRGMTVNQSEIISTLVEITAIIPLFQ